MTLMEHARQELQFLRTGDSMNEKMATDILTIVREFSKQGHSGFSANYAINALEKLLRYQPLRPLTGEDSEWVEVGSGVYQNNRCSRVFKENGRAYDIEGRVFEEPDGCCFTSKDSHVDVTFPYTPKTEYVKVGKPDVEAVSE